MMMKDHKHSVSHNRSQPLLILTLVLVAVGNITIPHSIPIVSRFYLILSLLLVALLMVYNSKIFFAHLRYPLIISTAFIFFIPGFLVNPLNEYGISKIAGIAISFLLVLAPFALAEASKSAILIARFLLIASLGTGISLLVIGETSESGRIILPGLNPIGTARMAGIAIVILTFIIISNRAKKLYSKLIVFFGILISLMAIITTGSRGPLIAAVVGIAVIFLLGWKAVGTRGYPTFIIYTASMTVLSYFLAPFEENNRITSTDSSGRDLLFSSALETIRSTPTGIGWGNFGYLTSGSFSQTGARVYPHNIFLEIGVEGGWIALAGFTFLIIGGIANLLRQVRAGREIALLILALLSFSLVNASLSSDLVGNRSMWLFIGLSLLQFKVSGNFDDKSSSEDDFLSAQHKPRSVAH